MAILLIRHGETAGNRDRILQTPEIPLSDRGLAQADRIAQRLVAAPITDIWTSPLPRARMTATAIEAATGVSAQEESDLQERSLGNLRGTAYDDLDFDPFMPGYAPPEGETWEVFNDRVDRIWAKVERHWNEHYSCACETRHFVVVTHGLFLRSVIERHCFSQEELDQQAAKEIPFFIANTSLTVVAPGNATSGSRHRIELLACAAHLNDDTAHDVDSIVGI